MISRRSPVPLWAQLAAELRRRFARGEFDDEFPTDKQLVEAYGVSRHTVRVAVRDLEQAGIVERLRGRGSFVRPGLLEEPLRDRYTLARAVPVGGDAEFSNQVLRCEVAAVPEVPGDHLGLPRGAEAVHVEWLRMAGADPTAVHASWVPLSVGEPLLAADLHDSPLYVLLARHCGVRITAGWEHLTAAVATKEQRRLLGMQGTAALHSERLALAREVPVEHRCSVLRGDRFRLVAEWSPETAPWATS